MPFGNPPQPYPATPRAKHCLMRRSFGYILFIICILFLERPLAFAVDVEQLEDLTGGAMPIVSLKHHDNFSNEYIYSVKVINQTGTPIVAGTLVLVLFQALDLAGKDTLPSLEVPNQDGNFRGKPYFVIPSGGIPELPSYRESLPIIVRLRSPDYVSFFPPSFRVWGLRRVVTQNFETLIRQLQSKGVLSEAEAQEALQPLPPSR